MLAVHFQNINIRRTSVLRLRISLKQHLFLSQIVRRNGVVRDIHSIADLILTGKITPFAYMEKHKI